MYAFTAKGCGGSTMDHGVVVVVIVVVIFTPVNVLDDAE
jgi:hypothetical protein